MSDLSRDRLRLLFMREGKLAGTAWPSSDEAPPSAVADHLTALRRKVAQRLVEWDEEDVALLEATYLAAARRARGSRPADEVAPEFDGSMLDRRIADLRSESNALVAEREALRSRPSDAVTSLVDKLASAPESRVTVEELVLLYREIGRLSGPLWIPETSAVALRLPALAVSVLKSALAHRLEPKRVFNAASSQFDYLGYEANEVALMTVLREAMHQESRSYFADFPIHSPLPFDPVERPVEEERRVAHRTAAIQRAHDAVDAIVAPIGEAQSSYEQQQIANRNAEAEHAERELASMRAQRGFPPPAPQPYGVSPRGAELWVADALRWLGVHDAEVTQQSNDGGVDVMSADYAVSVKHYAGAVPVEEIREIFGVAISLNKAPMLWTSGTLTRSAADFAALAPVAVINYSVDTASIEGANDAGHDILRKWSEQAPESDRPLESR